MDRKILTVLVLVLMIFISVVPCVYADISQNFPAGNGGIGNVNNGVKKIWGTVTTIVQILAFAAIVFAGLRYMFASADQKADIKKGLGMLTIGAVLVFAASTVVQFVVKATTEVIR